MRVCGVCVCFLRECFLNIFILVHVTETWRYIMMTVEKSLKLQILAPSFRNFPHQELCYRHSCREIYDFLFEPPSHPSKESIPATSKQKHNPRQTEYTSLKIQSQSQGIQKVPSINIVMKRGSHIHLYQHVLPLLMLFWNNTRTERPFSYRVAPYLEQYITGGTPLMMYYTNASLGWCFAPMIYCSAP